MSTGKLLQVAGHLVSPQYIEVQQVGKTRVCIVGKQVEEVSRLAKDRTIKFVSYPDDLSINDLSVVVSEAIVAVSDHVMCISIVSDLNLDGDVDSLHWLVCEVFSK